MNNKDIPWTLFWDMHSGGGKKEQWDKIYIQAPENEAEIIFYNRFGHSPHRVTCTCCGEDYSLSESESLEQASGYHRKCQSKDGKYVGGQPLDEYLALKTVLAIPNEEIKPEERIGTVPEQGYVWQD